MLELFAVESTPPRKAHMPITSSGRGRQFCENNTWGPWRTTLHKEWGAGKALEGESLHPQEPSLRHTGTLRVLSPEKRAESLNHLDSLIRSSPPFVETQTNASLAVSHIGKPSASGEMGSQRSDHQVIVMIANKYSQWSDYKVIPLTNKYFQRFNPQQLVLTPARHLAPREGLQHQGGRHGCG